MKKGLFLLDESAYQRLYGEIHRQEIERWVAIDAPLQTSKTIAADPSVLKEVELIFSGWGCPQMTAEFLEFSKSRGNDLSTPAPQYGFRGLLPGDRWCLCAERWVEAYEAGKAPYVVLRATHAAVLRHVKLDVLAKFSLEARVN